MAFGNDCVRPGRSFDFSYHSNCTELRPDMTEIMLTGTLNLNTNKLQTN